MSRAVQPFAKLTALLPLAGKGAVVLILLVAACSGLSQTPAPTALSSATPTLSATPSLPASRTPAPPVSTPAPRGTPGVWQNFDPPQLTPVVTIPPPLSGLVVPTEVRVLALAGLDQEYPYSGRSDAVALVIYHPRLARASVVSIPSDLFVYIPGYTMQRMNIAYAVGGPEQLGDTLAYNFGVPPAQYAVFNVDTFRRFIDDLGGINVTVLENVRRYCPTITTGVVLMDGEETLCYLRLRLGEDEAARNRRQQEVFRTVFLRLVEGGNFVRVPELYERYRWMIDTNVTLQELLEALPLALELGDPLRIGLFQIDEEMRTVWEISQQPTASVFLPDREQVQALMQDAISFVTTPMPRRERVVTLQYQLTVSPTATGTFTLTPTPTNTTTPTVTLTPTRTVTPVRSPTNTFAPFLSRTPTPTATQTSTPTITATVTP